jgi:Tfp pilus assembly protein PilZ
VVWQRAVGGSYLYGLYFTKIRDEDKEAIYQFVRGNLPQEIKKLWWEDFPAQEKGGRQMEEEKTVDRRVFERFPAEVAVRMLDTQSGQELQAKSVDISAKGLGLLAQQNLHLGAEVELWLQIPGSSEPLYNRGTLVWSTPQPQGQFRMGINLEKAELMGVGKLLRTRY